MIDSGLSGLLGVGGISLRHARLESECNYAKDSAERGSLIKATIQAIENCEATYSAGQISQIQYEATVGSLKQEISNLVENSKQLQETLKLQRYQDADVIKIQNSAISTTEHYEGNEKFVNDLYLRTIAKGNLSIPTTETSALLSIAHECPFLGGKAVYLARNLYRLVDPNEEYDDYTLCHSIGLMRHGKPSDEQDQSSFVFPNPANQQINLVYSLISDEETKLLIYDASLKLVKIEKLDIKERQKILNVDNLVQGLYIYNIVQQNHVISKGKFSIIH